MNYKFQVGELVEVVPGVSGLVPPVLALVTDRTYLHGAGGEVYTLLLPDGSEYEAPRDDLTKVSK